MTTEFLQINKDLWKLKIDADQQYILSYVMEFHRNDRQCYVSDESFSMYLNVSTKTVSRKIKTLVDKGYITKETINKQNGKIRYLKPVLSKIKSDINAYDNLQGTKCPLEESEENRKGQNDCCAKDNLSFRKGQNDLIKDNIKNNLKDNKEILSTDVDKISYKIPEVEEVKDGSRVEKAIPIAKEEAKRMIESGSTYRQLKGQLFIIDNLYYQISNI